MSVRLLLACQCLPALAATGCLHSVRQEIESFHDLDAAGLSRIDVDSANGHARIFCGAGQEPVRLRAIRFGIAGSEDAARERAESVRLVTERDALESGTLVLKAIVPAGPFGWLGSAGASFELEAPQGVDIRVRTSNGRVSVHGVRGNLDVKTTNGAIEVLDTEGDVVAHTSNGNISMAGVDAGRIHATTSNGAIEARRVSGEPTLRTSNGRICLQLDRAPRRPMVDVKSSNGSIELEVPQDVDAELSLSTSNGSIHHDLADFAGVSSVESSRRRLRAILNSGGGKIAAETSNGGITFRPAR